jgi:hypothetical protein
MRDVQVAFDFLGRCFFEFLQLDIELSDSLEIRDLSIDSGYQC